MGDKSKTKVQLLSELAELRQRVAELEASEARLKQAEETLAQERNLLRTLIDSAPDFVYVKDTESRFVLCNVAMARCMGAASPDELLRKTDFGFYPQELAAQYYADERTLFQSGQPLLDHEEPNIDAAGNQRWVSTIKVPLRDAQGKIIGLVGMSRDITGLKQTEEALERRVAQLALLGEIGKRIAAVLELESVLDRAARLVQESFGYHHVALFTVDRERDELAMRARAGDFAHLFPLDHRVKLGRGMVGWVGSHGERLLANDVRAEPHYINFYPDVIPTRSELSVPIRVSAETVGVLDAQSPRLNAFDENDVMVMETLADQIAVTIENARLYEAVQRELAERQRAEETVRWAEQRYHSLFEDAPVMYMITRDHEGVPLIADCNQLFLSTLGYTRAEVVGQSLANFYAPTSATKMMGGGYQQALSGHITEECELVTHDGHTVATWMRAMPETDTEGHVIGTRAMYTDITEIKQAQAALERRAAQLMLLGDIGKKIAAMIELESVLERAARLVQESFGYHHVALFTADHEQGELVMRARAGDFAHLFPLDHRIKLGQGLVGWVGEYGARLLANDVRLELRYTNFYPDVIPTLSELGVPILVGEKTVGVLDVQSPQLNAFDENDVMVMETLADQIAVAIENARLYEAVQRELTERRRAEEQLKRSSLDLEQSNEELKRFTYIVSHDLRAPLVNLKGFAAELGLALNVIRPAFEILLPHIPEEQRAAVVTALLQDMPEALSFIEASVTRMDHFITALLRLSRLGRRELDLERVDIAALLQETLQVLAHQIEQRQVKITAGRLPDVMADRTSMEQIMSNILNNAVIYLDPHRPGKIEITGERGEHETIFHIRDNGRGIAQEDMDKVFAPFRRAGKQDVPGEGMGLAYVQALVRRHGGRIWCESELNVGTTFAFTISNHLAKGNNHV